MTREERAICREAVDTYGTEQQMVVAVEELSELQKELCKHLRGDGNPRAMMEEIADVEIMLEQVKYMMSGDDGRCRVGVDAGIEAWKQCKLARLRERLDARKIAILGAGISEPAVE